MPVTCLICAYTNRNDAIFCTQCGVKLDPNGNSPTTEIVDQIDDDDFSRSLPPLSDEAEEGLVLFLVEEGIVIKLKEQDSIVLGRSTIGTSHLPDIDFGPFEGFAKGVSRKHAIIHNDSEGVFVSDLRTPNGTFVNRRRLKPFQRMPLKHNDVIALGVFHIRFFNYPKK